MSFGLSVQLILLPDNDTIPFTFNPSQKVEAVLAKLAQKGFPNHFLMFNMQVLDPQQTFLSYHIEQGSILYLIPQKDVKINFSGDVFQKDFSIELPADTTLHNIRDDLTETLQLPPEEAFFLHFYVDGTEVDYSAPLAGLRVISPDFYDQIQVVRYIPIVLSNASSGKKSNMRLTYTATVADLQTTLLQQNPDVTQKQITLTLDGKTLSLETPLREKVSDGHNVIQVTFQIDGGSLVL